jgi:hypothetical protein
MNDEDDSFADLADEFDREARRRDLPALVAEMIGVGDLKLKPADVEWLRDFDRRWRDRARRPVGKTDPYHACALRFEPCASHKHLRFPILSSCAANMNAFDYRSAADAT